MTRLPTREDLLFPVLKALEARGGAASNQEILEQVASDMALSDEALDAPRGNGPPSEVGYRLGWARTYLRYIGAVESPSRGVWAITERGREISGPAEARLLFRREKERRWPRRERAADGGARGENAPAEADGAAPDVEMSEEEAEEAPLAPAHAAVEPLLERSDRWEEAVLSSLRNMSPDAFERLCQRVLRESFTKVEVTGKSGDGGIDGVGVLRGNLLSFHVRFQCKRCAGEVGAGAIRDFRGAMARRADKGLLITTGSFTRAAQREAVRDGAPAIHLINGADLCHLLRDLNLGVKTEQVEVIRPDEEFFAAF